MDPSVIRLIEATGATHLPHPSGPHYAQFAAPLSDAAYAALDALFAAQPDLALRTWGWNSGSMRHVNFLGALPSVRRVSIDHGPIEDWRGLDELPRGLLALRIGEYAKRAPLAPIARCAGLELLRLDAPAATADYPKLAALTALTDVSLSRATLKRATTDALARAWKRVERLRLHGCRVEDWGFLAQLPRLRRLEIQGGSGELDVAVLGRLTALRELSLAEQKVDSLAPLGALSRLERLWVGGFPRLANARFVAKLTALRRFGLGACAQLTSLPSLAKHRALAEVTIHQLPQLARLAPVAAAPALAALTVTHCKQFDADDFRPFVGHAHLTTLRLGLGSLRKHARVRALLGLER